MTNIKAKAREKRIVVYAQIGAIVFACIAYTSDKPEFLAAIISTTSIYYSIKHLRKTNFYNKHFVINAKNSVNKIILQTTIVIILIFISLCLASSIIYSSALLSLTV